MNGNAGKQQNNKHVNGQAAPSVQGGVNSHSDVRRGETPHNNARCFANVPEIKNKGFYTSPAFKIILAFSVIALLLVIFAMINIFIGVREIFVQGNSLCTREEILSVAGIEEGSGYFSYNTTDSEDRIKEVYPCVTDIRISRSVFGKVTVSITEEKAFWYIESYNEYFALSDDLRVIKSSEMRDGFVERGLIRLDFPEVRSAVLGRVLEVKDGDRDTSYVLTLLDDVKKTNLYRSGRIDQIKIKNKFDVFIVVDCRHLVSIGNCNELQEKLDRVDDMLADGRFDWSKKTEITVQDLSSPSARENPELDFSHLLPLNTPSH